MKEISEDIGGNRNRKNNTITTTTANDEETLSRIFSKLKTYSLKLLELHQNPNPNPKKEVTSVISQLYEFLRETPPHALQPFLEYAMFPLLFLFDGAVACRSEQSDDPQGKIRMPNAVTDSVAEGVVQCLEELLRKCRLVSVNQMVVLLKKLTYGALLSPSVAAEEFREGIIRCFKALLLRLYPCSAETCLCKRNSGLTALIASDDLQIPPVTPTKDKSEPGECLLAFIRSEDASAAVGHWFSLLLKAADSEAERGHRGSAKIRIEAFLTFRVLVAKVGTADALAFFLPGVVSQIAKVMYVSKTMISGAAGSTEASNQAVRGLSEFLMIVLEDKANLSDADKFIRDNMGLPLKEDKTTDSVLDVLRHLPFNSQREVETLVDDSGCQVAAETFSIKEKNRADCVEQIGPLNVNRTKDWIDETSKRVDKLLSATFPQLCVHPAKKVRQGLVYAISGLLSKCTYTLKKSRLMLLECLCILVCDDSEQVSAAAQEFLEGFFMADEKHLLESEIAEIFNRLIEKLPKVVLGSDERNALGHAQQLLAIMYYAGPQLIVDHLLRSPIMSTKFLDSLALCLNQNSVFAGSLDKFVLAKPFSVGYLHSITELKSGPQSNSKAKAFVSTFSPEMSKHSSVDNKHLQNSLGTVKQAYKFPSMPPWFSHGGSHKLYQTLADILRLVGLSTIADSRSEVSLSIIVDIPLSHLRKLISEVRMKQYSKESWQSWYMGSGSGHLLRQASTAACILNEIIYGTSGQCVERYSRMFHKSKMKRKELGHETGFPNGFPSKNGIWMPNESIWKVSLGRDANNHLVNCVGSIIHEYLSSELWDLPIDQESSVVEKDNEADDCALHLFRDTEMLHQVIIEGIGVFSVSLGKDFSSSGFLHSSLYLLLENLLCSSYQIRRASDAVLHIISASCGYVTVGDLVVANADYIIDSLCRQLRHLDPNRHVADVLAALLSYIGVANEVLPLLEEPVRSVSLELEVLGRHQHPNLTVPFLKAVAEIVTASKREAFMLPTQIATFNMDVSSKLCNMERKASDEPMQNCASHEEEFTGIDCIESDTDPSYNNADMHLEHLEDLLFKFNKIKRYRRTVASIAESCLTAATPLLASVKESRSLVALDIIEDGIATLAKVEEAFRIEKETKQAIEHAIQSFSVHDLQDSMDAADEGTDENRLLPAMNKIWPYLVVCIKNKYPVAVRRCLKVVSSVVQICGGDFFSRRFHKDGHHFWKLLTPFQQKPNATDKSRPLQLPYRTTATSLENSMAETSIMKVQAAALNMIADLSRNKRSASALEAVLKKVSGFVVGIAFSSAVGLRDASINALSGLACIDPDLIWILLADVFYSSKKRDVPSPPVEGLPDIFHLLPSPSSPKDFLYAQYGGDSSSIDYSSVEIVFQKMYSEVFTEINV